MDHFYITLCSSVNSEGQLKYILKTKKYFIIEVYCLILSNCRDRPPQTITVQAEDGDTSVGLGGSTELRSLTAGATYEAWIAAHSAAGEGEPSAPQPATTTSRGISNILNKK